MAISTGVHTIEKNHVKTNNSGHSSGSQGQGASSPLFANQEAHQKQASLQLAKLMTMLPSLLLGEEIRAEAANTTVSAVRPSNPAVHYAPGNDIYNVQSTATLPYCISSYNNGLEQNKQALYNALKQQGADPAEIKLLMAVALQETNDLNPNSRDKSKDGTSSQNYTLFNLNAGMLRAAGYNGDLYALNSSSALPEVASVVLKALRALGPTGFLNYERGGSTGYKDGVSYDCQGYRNAIATIMWLMAKDPALLTNAQRVNIDVVHE